ncbi:AAA family ATPase [Rhizobium sp. ARZ01]|uniref:ATP-binding protein n=1 Tax=Rhizobium sp. ARZ01 TaxID=2769313 RepID=UPI001783C59E|nr:AAA family ATPase [Rhizobium sp. ARZ01]MBD9371848.1 AAA family ATPase [Rhizobium sp. ARZ01]
MRLNRLDLSRYGKFTDKQLDFGDARPGVPDFHLVYGPNEAGKSTLFSAYLDLLFGIEAQSAYGFLHPYPTMRIGGDVMIGAERHEIARLKRRQGSLVGPDDRTMPDTLFAPVLGTMDRQAYRMMFSLDDDSIERGGEGILKSEGELGALLFSASSGLSDIGQALERLKSEADAFFRPQARKHELGAKKAEIEALREERKAIDVAASSYKALTRELEASTERYEAAQQARAQTDAALKALERRLAAMPLHARLKEIRARLAEFDLGETPPKEWSGLVNQLLRDAAELSARTERFAAEREQRRAALDEIAPDPTVLLAEAQIMSLAGSPLEARYQTAQMDLTGRIAERERVDTEIAEKRSLVQLPPDVDAIALQLAPDRAEALSALVARRSGLDERIVAARREAEEAVRARETARAKAAMFDISEQDPGTDDDRLALMTLVRAAKQNALSTRLRDAERETAIADAALSTALHQLASWGGDIDGLRALDVPGREAIEALRQALRRHTDAALRVGDAARVVTLELASQCAGLERLRQNEALVGDDEAFALRSARDQAWKEHRTTLDAATADRFEAALRQDDRAVELRLVQVDRLSEMRLTERAIAENKARLDTLLSELQHIETESRALAERIGSIAARLGLQDAQGGGASAAVRVILRRNAAVSLGAAASNAVAYETDDGLDEADGEAIAGMLDQSHAELDAIEAWLSRRTGAIEAADFLSEQRAALAVARGEAKESGKRLSQALDQPEPEISAAAIDELLVRAEDYASALAEKRAQRRTALEALAQAESRCVEREAARKAAEAGIETWQQEWEKACADTWLSNSGIAIDASRAGALLPTIHAISRLVDSRRDLDRRIDGMRRDQADYSRMARELAETVGEAQSSEPLALVLGLANRLRAAKEQEARGERLWAELEKLEEEGRELDQRRAIHAGRAREICTTLNCETLTEASFVLEQYRKREDLRERADEAAHDFARSMLVASADEAEVELLTTDEGELVAELGLLRSRHEDQDREVQNYHAAKIKAADALAAIGGDGTVAALEERRRTLIIDLAERAKGYLTTRAGIAAAEAALRLYRERHRSAMMRQASEAFHTISAGEYSGLATVVEKEQEILVATAASGGTKLARELSKGTRFQLYLALRVAGYHEVAANREILPFIADDIMETFDDNRSLNAFRLMADMSKVGQVIYLTHHQHLRDIARKACPEVVIHDL